MIISHRDFKRNDTPSNSKLNLIKYVLVVIITAFYLLGGFTPSHAGDLPDHGMKIVEGGTALLVTDSHKVFGSESNDLDLQIRKMTY